GTLNESGCPSPANTGSIQDALNAWTDGGGFAALILARLPYEPWRSDGVSPACDCAERPLFIYVLAPSAEEADRTAQALRQDWRGDDSALKYVPLTPRLLERFEARINIASDDVQVVRFTSTEAA